MLPDERAPVPRERQPHEVVDGEDPHTTHSTTVHTAVNDRPAEVSTIGTA